MGYGYLDTRDLEKEIDDLESQQEDDGDDFAEDNAERLKELRDVRDEFDGRQWRDGETLIPESEWQEYAEETAYDVGFVDRGSSIAGYIDWERWASDLANDYQTAELGGETYYFRSY